MELHPIVEKPMLKPIREFALKCLNNEEIEKGIYNLSIRKTKQKLGIEKLSIKHPELLNTYRQLVYEYLSIPENKRKFETRENVENILKVQFEELQKEQEEEDAFIINPIEATEGIHHCFKCGSNKAVSYQLQTRSGDEGTTTFIQCANKICGSKWKM